MNNSFSSVIFKHGRAWRRSSASTLASLAQELRSSQLLRAITTKVLIILSKMSTHSLHNRFSFQMNPKSPFYLLHRLPDTLWKVKMQFLWKKSRNFHELSLSSRRRFWKSATVPVCRRVWTFWQYKFHQFWPCTFGDNRTEVQRFWNSAAYGFENAELRLR